MIEDTPRHRIFFALYPDAQTAERIARLTDSLRRRRGLTGRPVGQGRLHISLNFLGVHAERPDPLIARAMQAADGVSARSFVVAVNQVVSWKGAPGRRTLVLSGDDGVVGVLELHAAIHAALAQAGLARGPTPIIQPHLTLLRDQIETPEEFIDPLRWTAREFALTHSPYGESRHDLLGRWPLAPMEGR
jgi:2'-5' RNA ligase